MSRIENIKNLIINLTEVDFKDIVKSKLSKTAKDLAGGVVTGLARASGIPIVAGIGDVLGDTVSDAVGKLFQNKQDLVNKVESNYYFYHDTYNNFQTGNYGYDTDIPKDKFNSNELTVIRNKIYPSFRRFGYNIKFIEKRNDSSEYLFIMFRGNSKIPLRDNKMNPIIFPLPFDLFNNIRSSEDSDVIVYDLLKLFNIKISNI